MTTYFQNIKMKNIRTLRDIIKKNIDLPLDQRKAMFEFKTGTSPKKTNEYIKTLLYSNQISEEDLKE